MVRRVKNWVRFQYVNQRADTQVLDSLRLGVAGDSHNSAE